MPDTTDAELLTIVARLRREADELQARVDDMRGRADQLEAMVMSRATSTALHSRRQTSTVNTVELSTEHRLSISEGRRGAATSFLRHIRTAGYTHRMLAEALEISPSMLSKHRRPKRLEGSRPIPQERADKVAQLTGWPADAAHWPAGIS